MKRNLLLATLLFLSHSISMAQTAPFNVHLESMQISNLGGLQAFAFGQHNGKWLIVGGRLDGLHRRQPFAAFDAAGNNNQLIVVDPVSMQKWSAALTTLPTAMQEQLSSTNMQFHQVGNYLYLTGGYGYSATFGDHTTYANLTAIDVPATINAIIAGSTVIPFFRQISDAQFQVAGGHLKKINNTYYLIGGNKFIGRYNPQGPNHGPGFIQEYTNQVRRFTLLDDGINISINHLSPFTDATAFHRRDYNAVPQILPDGKQGITVFSGVFQPTVNLPYLNSVTIDSASYAVNDVFQQYYNHYHCAVVPLYSEANNEMHNVFFGGIAQYYDSLGVLIQDNAVPFVKTIARVSRQANGSMAEYKLPIEMPSLLGAGAEFIPISNVPQYENEVFKLDDFNSDSTLVGYIFGGISSTAANIFFSNTGVESSASSQLFKVYILKNSSVGLHQLNTHSIGALKMQVHPNPNDGNFVIKFNIAESCDVTVSLYNLEGKRIEEYRLENCQKGENIFSPRIKPNLKSGTYILTIETPFEKATQKLIFK
jgi:hypothetical protein